MTTFKKEWLPNDIDSVEKLWIWATVNLHYHYANTLYTDSLDENGEDLDLRVVEGNLFYLTAPQVPEFRYLGRAAVKLSPDHQLYGKLYQHAIPFDDAANPKSVPPELRAA